MAQKIKSIEEYSREQQMGPSLPSPQSGNLKKAIKPEFVPPQEEIAYPLDRVTLQAGLKRALETFDTGCEKHEYLDAVIDAAERLKDKIPEYFDPKDFRYA